MGEIQLIFTRLKRIDLFENVQFSTHSRVSV